jgi:hypothetical protein
MSDGIGRRIEEIRAEVDREIPRGYRFGEKRHLIRDIRIVVPIRYSDGATGDLAQVVRLGVEYVAGVTRDRFPLRIGPLTVDGVKTPGRVRSSGCCRSSSRSRSATTSRTSPRSTGQTRFRSII